MWLSVSASCAPLTSPSLTDSWEQCASAGNRTRVRWQRAHCLWKIFGPYRLQQVVFAAWHNLLTSTPHFVALFQPPVRNPQETLGNPHSCSGNLEVRPFAPLQGFHPASRVSFLGADASTSAQYWTEVTHFGLDFPGKTAWRVRWRRHATWNSRSVGYPHHWDSNPSSAASQLDTVMWLSVSASSHLTRSPISRESPHSTTRPLMPLDLTHIGSDPLPSCMTQPSHANPHRILWHCFNRLSETLRKPLETQGNLTQLQRKPGGNPSKCLHTPFAPLQGFHPASRVSFLGADASTSAQYWTEVTHNPWAHFPGKTAWRVRWRRHATWNSRSVGYPHHSLQVDTCGIRTHAGRPHRFSRLTP